MRILQRYIVLIINFAENHYSTLLLAKVTLPNYIYRVPRNCLHFQNFQSNNLFKKNTVILPTYMMPREVKFFKADQLDS